MAINKNFISKYTAFTLAEILITLGIIGVVAAMTIPTLISNYQKRAWTAHLQKSYAVLNQGFRRMLADDGVSELFQTETFQSIGGNGDPCGFYDNSPEDINCNNFFKNLRKYFNIAEIRKFETSDNYKIYNLNNEIHNDFNPYTHQAIILSDGTLILNYNFYSNDYADYQPNDAQLKSVAAAFFIDVNGTSKPNKLGRDIFYFYIGNDGIAYPYGSKAVASYYLGDEFDDIDQGYWKTTNDIYYSCQNDGESLGMGCTARVLEEGKMNY